MEEVVILITRAMVVKTFGKLMFGTAAQLLDCPWLFHAALAIGLGELHQF